MTEQVLDRMLVDVFADGPQAARPEVVRSAVETARNMGQRTARFPRLDRRAWPPQRSSLADPNVRQGLRLVLVAALALIAISASVVVGARLLQHPAPVILNRATIVTAGVLPTPADSAISLRDGRVLIAGATGTGLGYVFDPKTGSATPLGGPSNSMVEGAVDLGDGRAALLVWEYADPTPSGHSAIWLVDLASGIATRSGDTIHPRFEAAVGRLADGRVAMGGGISNPEDAVALSSAEAFDPVSGTFAELPQMSIPWPGSGSTPLGDGRLLLESQTGSSSAFVYAYSPATGAVVQLVEFDGRSRDAQVRAPVRLVDGQSGSSGQRLARSSAASTAASRSAHGSMTRRRTRSPRASRSHTRSTWPFRSWTGESWSQDIGRRCQVAAAARATTSQIGGSASTTLGRV